MKKISGESILDNYELVMEIEEEDVGKRFTFTTFHIPYGMGGGYVAEINVKEDSTNVEQIGIVSCDGSFSHIIRWRKP